MNQTKIDTSPLSFFRFVNVVVIIFLHYGLANDPFIKESARAGSIIVFFYMLSGFVLFLNYDRKGKVDLDEYLLKRTISLMPLYYLGFVIFSMILLYGGRLSLPGLLFSLLGIQAWVPGYQYYINPPSWFVSGLLFFYLIFPPMFSYLNKKAINPRTLISSSILLWFFTVTILNIGFNPNYFSGYFAEYGDFINTFPLSNFCSFYMGVCSAYYMKKVKIESYSENSSKSILSTLFILILFSLSLTIHYQKDISYFMQYRLPYEAGLYAPVVFLLILNLSTERNFLTKIFASKIFILSGMISYPLYILQAPLYHVYTKFSPVKEFILFLVLFILVCSVITYLENMIKNRFIHRVKTKRAGFV